jgi:hypothetical protein
MMLRNVLRYLLLLVFYPCLGFGQGNGMYSGEIKKAVNLIKNLQDMSYEYLMSADYPDGAHDQIGGTVYIGSGKNRIMYNQCDAFTMIYSSKWFYRADQRNKTVTILNLEKHLNKDFKQDVEKSVFQGAMAGMFLDSVVGKFASIKALQKDGDIVKMELAFPDKHLIKQISIVYNDKEKSLMSYSITTFQPWKTNEFGKNKGITQTISCTNFRQEADDSKYNTGNFFSTKKGSVALKKYKKYKLITKL